VEFPPDLCSRVTFVNFTVTRSSLQSQCLNQVLKAERPDVDAKRSDLLKLQGLFSVRYSVEPAKLVAFHYLLPVFVSSGTLSISAINQSVNQSINLVIVR